MTDLPLWRECRKCTRYFSTPEQPRCSDPFAPSGNCPLPGEHQLALDHPFVNQPIRSHKYAALLQRDPVLASIFHRWRRGDMIRDCDFLYIRYWIMHPDHYLKEEAPMHLLFDIVCLTLHKIADQFAQYNLDFSESDSHAAEKDPQIPSILGAVYEKVESAYGLVVHLATPEMVAINARQGSEWSRMVFDQILACIWSWHGCQHVDFSGKSDSEFREIFEKEWSKLAHYQDGFYGFTVTPRITKKDMVRYVNTPRGDVRIRNAISAYLSHASTESLHWIRPYAPKFAEVAFELPLRECYGSLIKAMAWRAMKNLEASTPDATSTIRSPGRIKQLRQDIEQQLWAQYEKACQDFKFYWTHRDRKRPLGKAGFVTLQGEEMKRNFGEMMRSRGLPFEVQDITEVPFAHFVQDRLKRWVTANYPPDTPLPRALSLDAASSTGVSLGERLSTSSAWNIDGVQQESTQAAVFGRDGQSYVTISQLSRRSGLTVEQLRRLDRKGIVPAKRVNEVCEKPWPLNPECRIYPLSPEFDRTLQLAKARLEKHSSRLEGQEVDRKTAAKIVGVSVATLCKWESQGLVQTGRKGKIVVYDHAALEQAKSVKQSSKRFR